MKLKYTSSFAILRNIIIVTFLISVKSLLAQPMSGTYSIGAFPSDYTTFNAAVSDLIAKGVAGAVTINVKPGNYDEQVIIPDISGTSASNTITFQSQNGDSTSVVLSYAPTLSSENFTLKLNGGDYIHFLKLKFSTQGTSYANVVVIANNSLHAMFSNCLFEGVQNAGISIDKKLVYSESISTTNESYMSFLNNRFNYGSYSVYILGGDSHTQSLTFLNNVFNEPSYKCIEIAKCDSLVFCRNQINSTASTLLYGVFLNNCYNVKDISYNKIYLPNMADGEGLALANAHGSQSRRALIANNFINVNLASQNSGLSFTSSSYFKIYNNNINVTGSDGSSAFGINNQCAQFDIQNNIFYNSVDGFAINCKNDSILKWDYNDIKTNAQYIGCWRNSGVTCLSAWKIITGQDVHSISITPGFISNSDLHDTIVTTLNSGNSLSDVTDDIDGNPRSQAPDIGAVEVIPLNNNCGIFSIYAPILTSCSTNTIKAVIKNYGGNNLTSAIVGWQFNGQTQTPIQWTGNIPTGGVDTLILSNLNVKAFDTVTVWTILPNGVADTYPANDTLKNIVLTNQRLSGTYIIGFAGCHFGNFTDAVSYLTTYGVCGPVIFNVSNFTYNEKIVIPAILGASAVNTITFQSKSGDSTAVILKHGSTSASENYVLRLDGAKYICFKKIKIAAGSPPFFHDSVYTRVVEFCNGASYNTITNCVVQGLWTYNDTYSENRCLAYLIDTTASILCSHNTISQSLLCDGPIGIMLKGFSASNKGCGNNLSGNVINNIMCFGISSTLQDSLTIQKNIITNNLSTFQSAIKITNNGDYCNILKNIISNTASASCIGIDIENTTATSGNYILVANNFISSSNNSSSGYFNGINLLNIDYIKVYNNSINITSSNTSSSAIKLSTGCNHVRLFDNILLIINTTPNTGGGYLIYSSITSGISCDYNDYYAPNGIYFYWNSSNIIDISSWQSTTGLDAHSINYDPYYISSSDLHISNTDISFKGCHLAEVTDDIDGKARHNTYPCIGAQEYPPYQNNVSATFIYLPLIPCNGSNAIQINFKNLGMNNLTSAVFKYSVNGVTQVPFTWTGNMPPGKEYRTYISSNYLTIGNYAFNPGVPYNIVVWGELPNGQSDDNYSDDTTKVVNKYFQASGTFTIGGTNPDYATFNDAVSMLVSSGVCGHVVFNVANGIYNEQISIPEIGTTASKTVIFQSASADSTSVTLTYSTNTLRLTGADYFTFRKMKIVANGVVIDIGGGSNHNCIENNIIEGAPNTWEYAHSIVYSAPGTKDNYNTFQNNYFKYGSYGIMMDGFNSCDYETGTLIKGNIFSEQHNAIQVNNTESLLEISNNTISATSSGMEQAIHIYNCNNFKILQNKIASSSGNLTDAIYLQNAMGFVIANNFIQGSAKCNGININVGAGDGKIYYNNINLTGTGTGNCLSNIGAIISTRVYNNIFVTNGTGYAVYLPSTNDLLLNNNDYLTNGPNIGYWGSTAANTMAAWQSVSGQDSSSISLLPGYMGNTDLHITNPDLCFKGIPIFVTNDIDNKTRNSFAPCIGAHEYIAFTNNIKSFSLNLSETGFCSATPVNIGINFMNHGSATVDSISFKCRINGVVQPESEWMGSLLTGATITNAIICNYTFQPGVIYTIEAWVDKVNGHPDEYPVNDTAKILNKNFSAQGNFTIGGINPDFSTFNDAVTFLSNGSICGPVVFNIADGTYNEQINLPNFTGSSSINTITFQSASNDSTKVILTYTPTSAADNYTIKLNGADYVRFKKMKIVSTGNSYGTAIYITNRSQHNIFAGNVIQGVTNSTQSQDRAVVFSPADSSSLDNYISFTGNLFLNGCHAICLKGYSSTNREKGIIINNNIFQNQNFYFILLQYSDSIEIKGNILISNSSSLLKGIYLAYCFNNCRIDNNKITFPGTSYSGSGIYLDNSSGTNGNENLIFNNFISCGGEGISLNASPYIKVYYNNVRLTGGSTNSRCLYVNASAYVTIKNNIFRSFAYIVYCTVMPYASDYNCFFTTGSYFGYLNNNMSTLATWIFTSGKDTHSLFHDPIYVSTTDLHITDAFLMGKGIPISGITTDIDGENRNTITPFMGADEFALTPPIADFTVSPDTGCAPYSVALSESPLQLGSIQYWDVNNDGIYEYTTPNATIIYAIPGDYSTFVKLKVVNAFGADSIVKLINIHVNPSPSSPVVAGPVTYCQYEATSPLSATGNDLVWYTSATGGTGSATAPTPPTSTAGTISYYVCQAANSYSCESPRVNIDVIVKAAASAPVVYSPVTYCQNETAYPLSATGSNLVWYTTATGGTGSVTAPTPVTSFAGTTTYFVSGNLNGCEGPRAQINVVVYTTPSAPVVTSTVFYCLNQIAYPLSATGSNLVWYTTATGGTGSYTAPTPVTTITGTTSYYVSSILNGCEGPRANMEVIVNSIPANPIVTSPAIYCQNETASALTATGSNLLWYTSATGGTGSAVAPVPNTTVVGTISYYVSQTEIDCDNESLRSTIEVIVNAIPTTPAVISPLTYCQNETATALTAIGSNLLWYTIPTGGTGFSTAPTPNTSTIGTTTYYVSQTVNGCEGPRINIDAVVNAIPSTPLLIQSGDTLFSNSLTGNQWYDNTGPIVGEINQIFIVITSGDYYVITTQNGCSSNPSDTINVFFSPVTQAYEIVISDVTDSSFMVTWISGAKGKTAIFVLQGSSGTAHPIDNTTYTPNTIFGSGDQIGISGWYCVYNGYNANLSVTGLLPATIYRVMTCEYNGSQGSEHYNVSASTNNPVNQITDFATDLYTYSNMEFYIFPNPANDEIEILISKKTEIEILNIEGQLLKCIVANKNRTSIDISGFAKGMYFVKVKTENGIVMKKFVKE